MHFGENQLSPGSIGILPLTTAHPSVLQHTPVRTSIFCYEDFILAMVSSPGFGSINSYQTPYSGSLSLRLQSGMTLVTAAINYSPAHSSIGTTSLLAELRLIVSR